MRPAAALPSFSAGSCFLSPPEGRLGVRAWALRGRLQANGTHERPDPKLKGADEKD